MDVTRQSHSPWKSQGGSLLNKRMKQGPISPNIKEDIPSTQSEITCHAKKQQNHDFKALVRGNVIALNTLEMRMMSNQLAKSLLQETGEINPEQREGRKL